MRFEVDRTRRNRAKIIIGTVVVLVISALVVSAVMIRSSYHDNLLAVSTNKTAHVVTIPHGSTTTDIADLLKSKGVIKSDWAFEWYVRNHELRDELKAGTYVFYQTQTIPEIVDAIVKGKIATDLVTILPATRIDQVKIALIKAGYSEADAANALDPAQYAGHPALVDKPAGASLEGYLYPESFQKTAETSAKDIIKLSLDEMQIRLTPDIRQAISRQGLTLHQGITLASIVENEVSKPEDRVQVAQVFLKRLKEGARLESDATNDYAKIDPAYNSYEITGLTPGPVSNVSASSLNAVAYPSQTDWLYFVSGDDGKTYFSKTLAEHQALTQKYCTKLCR